MIRRLERTLPAVQEFELQPWPESYGTDYYGALDVAARYCGLQRFSRYVFGTWQHGVVGQWEQVQPETIVFRSPKNRPCFVARQDEVSYLRQAGYQDVRAIGLPILYTAQLDVTREPGSLLVMPMHVLPSDGGAPEFDRYVEDIVSLRDRFTHVIVCVSANCIAKGYWAPQFEAKGIPVIRGATISDSNALERMRALFESFDYVTSNGAGSHIFYGLYFGAKVSIWGNATPHSRENMLADGTWTPFPDAVDRYLSEENRQYAEKFLGHLRVDPWKAVQNYELGRSMLGDDNKLSPEALRDCFGWTPLRMMGSRMRRTIRATRLWRVGARWKQYCIASGASGNNGASN